MTSMWTLTHGSTTQSLADWGLAMPRRRMANQSVDTVTLVAAGAAIDSTPAFSDGDAVTILRDGVVWFSGSVTGVVVSGSGRLEQMEYELSGPWYHLANRVYRQEWALIGSDGEYESVRKAHLYLGQLVAWADGNPTAVYGNIRSCIADVLAYMVTVGSPIAYDVSGLPEVVVPIVEDRDQTAAEAIRRMLRWIPDVVTWWDYSTTPYPTLHFTRRASLSSVSIPAGQAPLAEVELQPRYDLQVPCVQIRYERLDQVDDQTIPVEITQIWPASATGDELGALVATVDLRGSSTTTVSGTIGVSAMDIASPAWWAKHLPTHSESEVVSIELSAYTQSANPTTYPNELVEGAWYPWMPVAAAECECRARAHICYLTKEGQQDWRWEDLAIKVVVTNAALGMGGADRSHTFSALSSYESGEDVPERVVDGTTITLARDIYESLSKLQYSGRIELVEAECGDAFPTVTNWLAKAVNLTGTANAAFGSMAAMVQSVEESLDDGQTTLTFGPPEHLGPQDLVALLQTTRYRTRFSNPAVMAGGILQAGSGATDLTPMGAGSGASGQSQAPKGWEAFTVAGSATGPARAGYVRTTANDPDAAGLVVSHTNDGAQRSIDLSTTDCVDGHPVKVRPALYCMPAGPHAGEELRIDLVASYARDDEGNEYDLVTGALIGS